MADSLGHDSPVPRARECSYRNVRRVAMRGGTASWGGRAAALVLTGPKADWEAIAAGIDSTKPAGKHTNYLYYIRVYVQ